MAVDCVRHTLPYQVAVQVLASLDRATVMQLLVSLSGLVNARVAYSRTIAHALLASGSRRLSQLPINTRRLRLSKLLASPRIHRTAEELALTLAMLELYIGLLLRFFTQEASRAPARRRKKAPPVQLPLPALCSFILPRYLVPKARSNPPGSHPILSSQDRH